MRGRLAVGPAHPARERQAAAAARARPAQEPRAARPRGQRRGGQPLAADAVDADERAAAQLRLLRLPAREYARFAYPRLYPLHELADALADAPADAPAPAAAASPLPRRLSCSSEHLSAAGIFALDAGGALLVYVGGRAPPALLEELFGPDAAGAVARANGAPLELAGQGPFVDKVRAALAHLEADRSESPRARVFVAGANGACEQRFTSLLIEDQTRHDVSYVDFLCSVHRQIQAKLTA